MEERKKYEGISEAEFTEMEDVLFDVANKQLRGKELSEDYFEYVVVLQGQKYVTDMTLEEVRENARLAIKVLEELKSINNSGIDRDEWEKICKECEESTEAMRAIHSWNRIVTDNLNALLQELDSVNRVDGAWAMLIANPCYVSAVCAVYDRMVDSFDEDGLYLKSAYFLMRAAMKMRGEKYSEEQDGGVGNDNAGK